MGKIIYLMGKSASGKDTIFRELIKRSNQKLIKIVSYTTRPIRAEEINGREYHFVNLEKYLELKKVGLIIEEREYNTYLGKWLYFTVYDEKLNLENGSYILIGTLQGFISMCKYFGREKILPIYIELDDSIRLQRALNREITQENPRYAELCRRYLADEQDFSMENLENANITQKFINEDLESVLKELEIYISSNL